MRAGSHNPKGEEPNGVHSFVGQGVIAGESSLIAGGVFTSNPQGILDSPSPEMLADPDFEEIVRSMSVVTYNHEVEYSPSQPLIYRETKLRLNDQVDWILEYESQTTLVEYLDAVTP